jgi:hypothetical protein
MKDLHVPQLSWVVRTTNILNTFKPAGKAGSGSRTNHQGPTSRRIFKSTLPVAIAYNAFGILLSSRRLSAITLSQRKCPRREVFVGTKSICMHRFSLLNIQIMLPIKSNTITKIILCVLTIALFKPTQRFLASSIRSTTTTTTIIRPQRQQTQQATKRLTLLTATMAGTKLQDSKSNQSKPPNPIQPNH